MASYSPEFKQEVNKYWKEHGPTDTYKQYSRVSRDILRSWCDEQFRAEKFVKERKRFIEYYKKNKDRSRQNSTEWNRNWRKTDPEEYYKYHKERYERLKEQIKEYHKKRREDGTHEKVYKEWYEKAKPMLREYAKAYTEKNKESIRKRVRDRKKTDINFKILENLRHRTWDAVKDCFKNKEIPFKKEVHTAELFGCSLQELVDHLRKQYKDGMNDQNYGDWHIDHIVPCSKFDLTQVEEQKKCFHYTNLQPLWASENLKKSNK